MRDAAIIFAAIVLAITLTGLVWAASVRAQTRDVGLTIAQGIAHECGVDCSADEAAAIVEVARSRCRGCSLDTAMRHAMRRFYAGVSARPIFLAYTRRTSRPYWSELLETADGIVAGLVTHRCDGRVDAWGMRHGIDLQRAKAGGWIEVQCSDVPTRNALWRFPRRGDD